MTQKQVVLAVTGSIAAYKAGDVIRRLQDKGCDVTVIMTACAEKFVTPLTFEALSGKAVSRDMFSRDAEWDMAHISLAKRADVYVVAPATANVIGKIAHGIADDLVTAMAISTKAPMVIAPAMNTGMFTNPIVQDNIARLKSLGVTFVEPKTARLACGDTGQGALADIDVIVKTVTDLLSR